LLCLISVAAPVSSTACSTSGTEIAVKFYCRSLCAPVSHTFCNHKIRTLSTPYNCNMGRFHSVFLLTALLSFVLCGAYTVAPKGGGKRPSSKRWFQEPKGRKSPTSPTSPEYRQDNDQQPRQGTTKLSQSVLARCDTLPSFPTAHGLLSPETVMLMETRTSRTQRSSELSRFLTTYRRHGPMSCLPMLSDPSVLPHLTEALRDIA
jgi:hypothetical protein